MDLLIDRWIPVRGDGGAGEFRLLSLEELLCGRGNWWVSLPRDDLELACIQLLVCMAQVMFIPKNDVELRQRLRDPLTPDAFADGIAPYRDWYDLDHPTQPFMQSRSVKGELTSIQKLLPGMPEKTSASESAHCFFNEISEIERVGSPVAAIALFNQASNSPSFGGGFKGSLRGGAPITTLVKGRDLLETVWRNVVTLPRLRLSLPGYELDFARDRPTWVDPIHEKQVIFTHEIGLIRGLFWQPARVELVTCQENAVCDVLGGEPESSYRGFRKEKFSFTIKGPPWPHLHGAMMAGVKEGVLEWKFASFNKTAPVWTLLSEFVVPRPLDDSRQEGSSPAAPVNQAPDAFPNEPLHLLVGGYRAKKASVVERRHELFTLAEGWDKDRKGRITALVELGKAAGKALHGKLRLTAQGDKKKGMKGIGVPLQKTGERLFYWMSESLFHETLREGLTFSEWQRAKVDFATRLADISRQLFDELTKPYSFKPELIPIVAWARRSLEKDLGKLKGGTMP
jgi:CRISPR system Cascade subunit CasA